MRERERRNVVLGVAQPGRETVQTPGARAVETATGYRAYDVQRRDGRALNVPRNEAVQAPLMGPWTAERARRAPAQQVRLVYRPNVARDGGREVRAAAPNPYAPVGGRGDAETLTSPDARIGGMRATLAIFNGIRRRG